MATLSRELRKELERTVIKARGEAESGAKKALEQLAVHNHEPWSGMTADQRSLRNRLRAHGRQLGDRRDAKSEKQTTEHLVTECAYEHWHRMLFTRFLAECDLLIEPDSGVSISLSECQQLARERGADWLALASSFAVRMLPEIFRVGDPALEVSLPPETRHVLEGLLNSLPREVFVAEDSLGWVYQFWQSEEKDRVNDSEVKIGADELAAVTQLFTEDYMVLFLLHNTLGAWWAAKRKAEGKKYQLPGYEWTYLRFKDDGTPAAGSFDGWPSAAKDIKVLDPCEGSGHFLAFALPILTAFRMEEEGFSRQQAVEAVLRDNLFGLELDLRCTQIAAFDLALAAWRMVGHCNLPKLNVACSGLGINAKEEDWVKLAGKDERLRGAMKALYALFQQAPVLGSLIDPRRVGGNLFVAEFEKVQPLLENALATEQADETTQELAVTAQGLVQAVRFLAAEFTLVVTNVPYLSRNKQTSALQEFCDNYYPRSKTDLGTTFMERCLEQVRKGGTAALVVPRIWTTFTAYYRALRERILKETSLNALAMVGKNGFETIGGEVVDVSLIVMTRYLPSPDNEVSLLDVSEEDTPAAKAALLKVVQVSAVRQSTFLMNPGFTIAEHSHEKAQLLADYVQCYEGLSRGDVERFDRQFWELNSIQLNKWAPLVNSSTCDGIFSGVDLVMLWEGGSGELARAEGARIQGEPAWGHAAVFVSRTHLNACATMGFMHAQNGVALVPRQDKWFLPVLAFCRSEEYRAGVLSLNQKLIKPTGAMDKVPFDLPKWTEQASQEFPSGTLEPFSADPTQLYFSGVPSHSGKPLQVSVARLLGYMWPCQTGSGVPGCSAVSSDGLEKHVEPNGIVCLNPTKGEQPAAARLRDLLADAFGHEWSAAKQAELLSQVGYVGRSLEEWLRDGFFEQHCQLFHQRPFIWHIWDGLKDGFHALVNYHKLSEGNGVGRRTLERLIYSYLGDWIERQRADQKAGVEGADARVAAATHLRAQLEKILEGEPPYDVFVRWKPLHEQAIGWEPDLNDGVRSNIRPFVTANLLTPRGKNSSILRCNPKLNWDKDKGKDPRRAIENYPWLWSWDGSAFDFGGGKQFDGIRWNDLHYSRKYKQAARERFPRRQSKGESRP